MKHRAYAYVWLLQTNNKYKPRRNIRALNLGLCWSMWWLRNRWNRNAAETKQPKQSNNMCESYGKRLQIDQPLQSYY